MSAFCALGAKALELLPLELLLRKISYVAGRDMLQPSCLHDTRARPCHPSLRVCICMLRSNRFRIISFFQTLHSLSLHQHGTLATMLARLSLSLLLAWFWGVREAAAMTACSSGSAAVKYFSLDITSSYAAPDGFARAVYFVNGQSPGPLLNATQGETFAVNVVNRLPMEIGMHWHGLHQEGTPEYDGVPGVNQYAIPPGANVTYCFGTETNYGTYWYHIHLRDIYQDGVRGPILIQPNSSVARPYNKIST
ncbi:multicopper oxidase, partial [Cystobasidium minutum MCA 4210]|uniref:multicopper oxidase n=1 Tax=Cystobasidium minutum MCA 4210 TaxID=1397322 RepID=UPI0034CF860D